MLSGRSPASWSVPCAATTVTVQVSPPVKSVVGSSVNVVGPPLSANVCAPDVVHEIVNEDAAALTASSNVTVTLVSGDVVLALVGVVAVTLGGLSVVNDQTKFASMLSGGSLLSLSLTCAANTVAVHSSPLPKSVFGSTVHVVGPPLTVTVCAPEVPQLMSKLAPAALTDSSKLIVTFVFDVRSVAPFAGVVELTDGAASTVKLNT